MILEEIVKLGPISYGELHFILKSDKTSKVKSDRIFTRRLRELQGEGYIEWVREKKKGRGHKSRITSTSLSSINSFIPTRQSFGYISLVLHFIAFVFFTKFT